jgi:hypothetical protein
MLPTSAQVDIWSDRNVLLFLQHPHADNMLYLATSERKRVVRRSRFYDWDGTVLHRRMPSGTLKQVPQAGERLAIVKAAHETAGHFGRRRTTALVMLTYWWSGLWQDCRNVVQGCHACSQTKVAFNATQPVLRPLPIKGMFYRWGLDIAGPFVKTSRGHTYLLVCVEHFSKYIEVFPLHTCHLHF